MSENTNTGDKYKARGKSQYDMQSLFFTTRDKDNDRIRIDYVLIYSLVKNITKRNLNKRNSYLQNLKAAGLMLEKEKSANGKFVAVKVHGPWPTLLKYAEIMCLKLPLKYEDDNIQQASAGKSVLQKHNPFTKDETAKNYTYVFRRDKLHMFNTDDRDKFLIPTDRIRIIHDIMTRTKWNDGKIMEGMGYNSFIAEGFLEAAFPLHDGPLDHLELPSEGECQESVRNVLYHKWATASQFNKMQPIEMIRQYYGEKIAFYFSWMELYTFMLIPASIMGMILCIYSIATLGSDIPILEICDRNKVGNFTICPQCDKVCTYGKLYDSCLNSKVTYIVDNEFIIPFGVMMTVWGAVFLRLWERKQAELRYKWDVKDFHGTETVRSEYEAKCRESRINPVTGLEEPFLTKASRIPRYVISSTTAGFMIILVIGFIFAIIMYRVSMIAVLSSLDISNRKYVKIGTNITAALLNLVLILVFNYIYRLVAVCLTNFECPRTETDYDKSLTLKIYCFQFVNCYGSLFYIAFFKGSFRKSPANSDYQILFRQEECDPSGCLSELCIQMLIVFSGRQIYSNVQKIFMPWFWNYCARRRIQRNKSVRRTVEHSITLQWDSHLTSPQWQKDWSLLPITHLSLFDDYLENILQFGFISMFVTAFPLAPLLALINNIMEIRIDAFKWLAYTRRPFPACARGIGIWYRILRGMVAIGVLTNAFVIGYTSDAITRLFYKITHGDGSLKGFVNFTLSVFNTSDFQNKSIPATIPEIFGDKVEICRYRSFREPPSKWNQYEYSKDFWHLFTIRFVFILFYEHIALLLNYLIAILIPDKPKKLRNQMKREAFMGRELIFQNELAMKLDYSTTTETELDKVRFEVQDEAEESDRDTTLGTTKST